MEISSFLKMWMDVWNEAEERAEDARGSGGFSEKSSGK